MRGNDSHIVIYSDLGKRLEFGRRFVDDNLSCLLPLCITENQCKLQCKGNGLALRSKWQYLSPLRKFIFVILARLRSHY